MELTKKKYPISINNKQCIGPCYEPGTYIIHPITLSYLTHKNKPFCPTMHWFDEKNKTSMNADICIIPSSKEDIDRHQIELSFIVPTFSFNCDYFLKTYYDIFSFESALDWISNNQSPLYTQLRIIDCSWKVYGSNVDILNDQLIDLYIYIIKKEWIKNIYPVVEKYIYVDQDKIYFSKNSSTDEYHVEKINFLIKKITTKQFIYKFLNEYINEYKSVWSDIESHNKTMLNFLINFVVRKIEATISKKEDF
jgi:hypothetical protein